MFCQNCGKQIPDDSVFCEFCGQKIAGENPPPPINIQQQAPSPKKNRALPIILTAAAVVVVGVGGFLILRRVTGKNVPTAKVGEEEALPEKIEQQTEIPQEKQPEQVLPPTETPQEKQPEQVPPQTETPPAPQTETPPAPKTEPVGRPELSEFDWSEQVLQSGFWEEGQKLTDFNAYSGRWKAMMIFDPLNVKGAYSRSLLNVEISGSPEEAKVICDWYQMLWQGGDISDESQNEDSVFVGTFNGESGDLNAVGDSGEIRLNNFCQYQDKQYCIGSINTQAGIFGHVLLVR